MISRCRSRSSRFLIESATGSGGHRVKLRIRLPGNLSLTIGTESGGTPRRYSGWAWWAFTGSPRRSEYLRDVPPTDQPFLLSFLFTTLCGTQTRTLGASLAISFQTGSSCGIRILNTLVGVFCRLLQLTVEIGTATAHNGGDCPLSKS
jgi:hypothetical protein